MSPRWGLDTKTDWLTDRQSQCDFDFDLTKLVVSWELTVESQAVKRRLGGYFEMAASLGVSQLSVVNWELSSAREAVKIGPERVKLKNLHF
jgi:hypothetical protein